LGENAVPTRIAATLLIVLSLSAGARGQFKEGFKSPGQPERGTSQSISRYQVGVIVTASAGACTGIRSTVPLPGEWPEQSVREVEQEITPGVRRRADREISGVRQMVIDIPRLAAGTTAKALVTVEIKRSAIAAPAETGGLKAPEKLDRDLRQYILPSPYIESRHGRIREAAKEAVADKENDWKKVEGIYDYVREKVKYKNGKLKGALRALQDGDGDCEEMTSLFIAMCRAENIAARTVWVPGHCYPEFYLVGTDDSGNWYPCQAAGTREFGGIAEHRPILQKGDNFKDPDRPRKQMRYMAEFLRSRDGQPTVQFVRRQIAVE
jgi:transglutaminase-like putative cysteine protease